MNTVRHGPNPAVEPARILLVDDEPHVLSALERVLRNGPWSVETAGGGDQALEHMARQPSWVVISDYLMPGMDGVELLAEIRRRWPITRRVMLTGHADAGAIERAVNQGEIYRFLNKPWHPQQLLATVRECVEQYRLACANLEYERELCARNTQLTRLNAELEEQVRRRTEALLQSEKMAALGRMAGGVAHEINNPLGGILAFAQVLQRDLAGSGPDIQEGLQTIRECALRCKTIVDHLLSFSRRARPQDHQPVDLNRTAEAALALLRLDVRYRERPVEKEFAAVLPPVLGQDSLLQQVVLNLLQNAFQASPPDRPVYLRTGTDGESTFLEVEDRGSGIPNEVLSHIFEPFFTTKPAGEGTGLGLSICYGIAREHGGDIRVRSQFGQGTAFRLLLPQNGARSEVRS
ncbi:MAG: response regulator [Myxococcales bacterium]|nr:response regulator [Myxococcales bacterium]